MTQTKIIPSIWVEMGYHALGLEAPLSLWDGSLACGAMEERESEWLERKMVLRHSLGKHNSMQGRNELRVTPTPLFIPFLGIFRVLSPWLGL